MSGLITTDSRNQPKPERPRWLAMKPTAPAKISQKSKSSTVLVSLCEGAAFLPHVASAGLLERAKLLRFGSTHLPGCRRPLGPSPRHVGAVSLGRDQRLFL